MEHFAKLRNEGVSEDKLLAEYVRLDSRHVDAVQQRSWFLDQVLHPHETQHTLAEVMDVFKANNVKLLATSINDYAPITNMEKLYEQEKSLYDVGMDKLKMGEYYPGFFYVYGEKN